MSVRPSKPNLKLSSCKNRPFKRLFDILFSASALLLLVLPLSLLICLVRVKLGRPVFFTQLRAGMDSKSFKILKFRTMTDERGSGGELLPDSVRLTPFGRFLRNTSLDELPELWNVLRGDMSLVGPRPLLMKYLPLYNSEQARRHQVRPGITGWAQINGRNAVSWQEKFRLDVWYIDHMGFSLDLRILLVTIFKVVFRHNVYTESGGAMPIFTGNKFPTDSQ